MRTAFILLVSLTAMARESNGDAESWIKRFEGMNREWVSVLEAGENRLYAGTSERIYISQNDGYSWYTVAFKDTVTAIAADGDTVYAGTRTQGVFRSDDAGVTWKPIRDGLQTYKSGSFGEVRRILVMFDEIINVMYHKGTYASNDRGETWLDLSREWERGDSIHSIQQFDGYLWCAISISSMARSSDNGRTWESLRRYETGHVIDWAILNNRLYIAGGNGVGRWNEKTQDWEYPMKGLPNGSGHDSDDPPSVLSLAVHGGRLYAGLKGHGIYVFDARTDTWGSVGLDGRWVYALLSYKSSLYAGADDGLYSAAIDRLQPHGKAVTTWASLKQGIK
ncbi:MAG: hypothetical protein OXN17_18615 [Candidatus Poribacteria bacterium]|nr:hypothetical protein [Candidatus Poribacteria bacterium]MDE0503010.1 hypothetical protein [Candidatus Poribacteria bacterium]